MFMTGVLCTVYGAQVYLGHKLPVGQTDHEGHHDLWGHKVGHGDL